MHRPLLAAVALIAAVAALAPAAALAAPAPEVTSLKIYRTPSGADKGALTVIAMLDYTGFAKADDVAAGHAPPLTRATVTLTGAHHRVVARDSVMVHPLAFRGAPERLDFRIPAARAKASATSAFVCGTSRAFLPMTMRSASAGILAGS